VRCRGHSFLSLNEGLLDRYAACDTAAAVIEAQNEYLESLRDGGGRSSDGESDVDGEGGGGYLRASDLPPSDSDEYGSTSEEEEGEELATQAGGNGGEHAPPVNNALEHSLEELDLAPG